MGRRKKEKKKCRNCFTACGGGGRCDTLIHRVHGTWNHKRGNRVCANYVRTIGKNVFSGTETRKFNIRRRAFLRAGNKKPYFRFLVRGLIPVLLCMYLGQQALHVPAFVGFVFVLFTWY